MFQREINIEEEFGEIIFNLKETKDREALKIAGKIKGAKNAFTIIEAFLEIESIVPYDVKSPNKPYDENELYGYRIIWKTPLLKAYDKIIGHGYFLFAIYGDELYEMYRDIFSLRGIMDIIKQNIWELTRPTKGVVNDGSLFFAFFAAIGCGFSDGSFSLRTFIVAFIVIEALFIIKELWFPKK